MATIPIQRVSIDTSETYQLIGQAYGSQSRKNMEVFLWEELGEGDDGQPLCVMNEVVELSFHMIKNSGTVELAIEGSNTGANWVDLQDQTGTAIAATDTAVFGFVPYTLYVRPDVTSGTSADVDIYVVVRYK